MAVEPPVIFDFTKGRVYKATEDPKDKKDLMTALRESVRLRKRIVARAGATPPPPRED